MLDDGSARLATAEAIKSRWHTIAAAADKSTLLDQLKVQCDYKTIDFMAFHCVLSFYRTDSLMVQILKQKCIAFYNVHSKTVKKSCDFGF